MQISGVKFSDVLREEGDRMERSHKKGMTARMAEKMNSNTSLARAIQKMSMFEGKKILLYKGDGYDFLHALVLAPLGAVGTIWTNSQNLGFVRKMLGWLFSCGKLNEDAKKNLDKNKKGRFSLSLRNLINVGLPYLVAFLACLAGSRFLTKKFIMPRILAKLDKLSEREIAKRLANLGVTKGIKTVEDGRLLLKFVSDAKYTSVISLSIAYLLGLYTVVKGAVNYWLSHGHKDKKKTPTH